MEPGDGGDPALRDGVPAGDTSHDMVDEADAHDEGDAGGDACDADFDDSGGEGDFTLHVMPMRGAKIVVDGVPVPVLVGVCCAASIGATLVVRDGVGGDVTDALGESSADVVAEADALADEESVGSGVPDGHAPRDTLAVGVGEPVCDAVDGAVESVASAVDDDEPASDPLRVFDGVGDVVGIAVYGPEFVHNAHDCVLDVLAPRMSDGVRGAEVGDVETVVLRPELARSGMQVPSGDGLRDSLTMPEVDALTHAHATAGGVMRMTFAVALSNMNTVELERATAGAMFLRATVKKKKKMETITIMTRTPRCAALAASQVATPTDTTSYSACAAASAAGPCASRSRCSAAREK